VSAESLARDKAEWQRRREQQSAAEHELRTSVAEL
jgi:hypothetical protein